MPPIWQLEIIVYDDADNENDFPRRQARYLVHGHDDVLWTDEIEQAVGYLRNDLEKIQEEQSEGVT